MRGLVVYVSIIGILLNGTVFGQNVYFSYSDIGVTKAMTEWGADTAWPSFDNMRWCIAYMGTNEIDVVRLNFFTDEPLDGDGRPGPNSRAQLDYQLYLANLAGDKPIALTPSTGSGPYHPSYLDATGTNVIPSLWLDLMTATKDYVGKPLDAIEPFNEPDWTWGPQGTPQTLYDILVLLQSSPDFQGVELDGPSTLSCTSAQWWYDQANVSDPLTRGTTHHIGWGPSSDYVNFIKHVIATGDESYNPELHSMAEVLFGCEYGMTGGIWWGPALLPRGVLVHAVQGKRLGYAENLGNNCAAAVYRAPDGEVYGFAGSVEYYGPTTCYRFVSTDQDLYFNGIGPIREFMYPTWLDDQGGYFNIDDTPSLPALDGHRWKIANRSNGYILEVAGGSTGDGVNVDVLTDFDFIQRKWNIVRDRRGYYALYNAKSGRLAEVANWSLDPDGNIQQYGDLPDILPRLWYIEDAGEGYFYIRNAHSCLYMAKKPGTNRDVRQQPFDGSDLQQWKFVLDDPVGGGPVAHYEFENNANDGVSTNNGTAYGTPAYPAGQVDKAINLDGANDYVKLPSTIANVDDITIAAWVNWDGGAAAQQRIFDFGNNTTEYMFLTPSDASGQMHFGITTNSYPDEHVLLTDALPSGQWVHIAVTLCGNTGILYIDGSPKVAGYISWNPSDFNPVNNLIGDSQWSSDPYFNGRIDDFRIYDYALDADAVAALTDLIPPAVPTNLVATAGDGSVSLDWADNTDPDWASYTVYRSTTSGSNYVVVASGLNASTNTDTTVTNGTTYYYVVSATDSNANESAYSMEVSAVPSGGEIDPGEFHIDGNAVIGGTNMSLTVSDSSPGLLYQMLSTESLTTPDWQPEGEALGGNGSNMVFKLPITTSNRYFKLDVQWQ